MLYCRKISIYGRQNIPRNGPIIFSSNHPNSFFDALIIGTTTNQPVHFLTRGDAFNKPFVSSLLKRLNMIPVYRLSEGRILISKNEQTFADSLNVLQENGSVLFFSEGICKNEWTLRPLKKGTARLAWRAWQEHNLKQVVIQPITLSYDSFDELPKTIVLNYGHALQKSAFNLVGEQEFYNQFNQLLATQLENGLVAREELLIPKPKNSSTKEWVVRSILALPALIGFLLHVGYFRSIRSIVLKKTKNTVFYDSILFGVLLISYPLMLVLLAGLLLAFHVPLIALGVLIFMPFTVWCYSRFKRVI